MSWGVRQKRHHLRCYQPVFLQASSLTGTTKEAPGRGVSQTPRHYGWEDAARLGTPNREREEPGFLCHPSARHWGSQRPARTRVLGPGTGADCPLATRTPRLARVKRSPQSSTQNIAGNSAQLSRACRASLSAATAPARREPSCLP